MVVLGKAKAKLRLIEVINIKLPIIQIINQITMIKPNITVKSIVLSPLQVLIHILKRVI